MKSREELIEQDVRLWKEYRQNWPRFAKEVLGVKLDDEQIQILRAVQTGKRISVRSGHARGKDFISAVASLCFLLLNYPSKVIETAPTGRQVTSIMMSEISKIHKNAKIKLPGTVLTNMIKFEDDSDWFLIGFKAGDKDTEAWTGFHSPNILVVATEASGIASETFDAIEGLLTGGNAKFLIVFNPNDTTGEAYKSVTSPYYEKFRLSCLDAPNVKAKKQIIPGQVDYEYVKERVERWCTEVDLKDKSEEHFDFEWEGKIYRPNDLFRVKVLGEFPAEGESQLIPLRWVEMANKRWEENKERNGELMLGADVAGMGRDETVFAYRYGYTVEKIVAQNLPVRNPAEVHMAVAGKVKNELSGGGSAYMDTIGEGAGVHSRLLEQDVNSVSVKFSESAKGLTDITGERTFANMRAFCYWAIRDALDPKTDCEKLALPPNDKLTQDLTSINIKSIRSDGSILLEPKEDIKKRLGRSPDYGDALAVTFYKSTKRQGWVAFSV